GLGGALEEGEGMRGRGGLRARVGVQGPFDVTVEAVGRGVGAVEGGARWLGGAPRGGVHGGRGRVRAGGRGGGQLAAGPGGAAGGSVWVGRGAGVLGEYSWARDLAERPEGRAWMFSFWVSIALKSIRSPVVAMVAV